MSGISSGSSRIGKLNYSCKYPSTTHVFLRKTIVRISVKAITLLKHLDLLFKSVNNESKVKELNIKVLDTDFHFVILLVSLFRYR